MNKKCLMAGIMLAGVFSASLVAGAAENGGFQAGETTVGEKTMQYQLFDPSENGYEEEAYPLVLFLHGEDAVGTDNEMQLTADVGANFWIDPVRQDVNPSYVLAPQCQDEDWTDDTDVVKQMLDDVVAEAKVDTDRIYVVGLSSGATEAWKLLLDYPDIFAGALPICGQVPAEYYDMEGAFEALANMPVWAFHAKDDDVVPEAETAKAIQALKDAGSNCAKYEDFTPGSVTPSHAVWEPAFLGVGTAYNWLMMQTRERNALDPSMQFASKKMSDQITRVNDYELGNIWVIDDGGDQVMMIDTAMGGYGEADLYAYLKENVFSNPDAEITVAFTHNHGDHTYGLPSLLASGKVKKIYINANDLPGLQRQMDGYGYDLSDLVETIKEGDTITAGDISLDVIDTPDHSEGSVCFFMDNIMFSGDSIGSGYLWLPYTYIDHFVPIAQHVVDEMEARGADTICSGHFENYETFHLQYAKDILACAQGIVSESIPWCIYTRQVGPYATVGSGNIYFNIRQVHTPAEQ